MSILAVEKISKLIFPRPTALVTTCNKEGKPNVASFSFVMPISFDPKYVCFAVAPERYTFNNLQEVREFVLNMATEDMLKEVWICGSESGRDVDKFKLANLETVPSVKVKPLRIKKCPVQLECVVELIERFGDHYLVVGKVVAEHVETTQFKPIMHYSSKEFYKVGEKVVFRD
ncbi:MAG: flavin reductase family protein [Candidatus Methanomethylicota archaeon]|uniref:Flavin reductase family protein n=1 Tax=Thermoproteota archaeon TaxID=2056631 RepID=A0A497EMK7_9CREN|nr:MAG: flavin reductase family protein [Candidatus Verstraetearchaeota archaeon]